MKRTSRSVKLQDERFDDGSSLSISATLESDGSLEISGHDLGPVTDSMSGDGEYEFWYTVAAEDVPALVIALGGEPGADILDVLQQRCAARRRFNVGRAIRSSRVGYEFHSYP